MAGRVVEQILGGSQGDDRHASELRNVRQHLMLDVRCKNGNRFALPYSYLMAATMHGTSDGERVLELLFTTHRVRITGRNLHLLYDRLLGHGLGSILESDSPFDDSTEEMSFVATVDVTSNEEA